MKRSMNQERVVALFALLTPLTVTAAQFQTAGEEWLYFTATNQEGQLVVARMGLETGELDTVMDWAGQGTLTAARGDRLFVRDAAGISEYHFASGTVRQVIDLSASGRDPSTRFQEDSAMVGGDLVFSIGYRASFATTPPFLSGGGTSRAFDEFVDRYFYEVSTGRLEVHQDTDPEIATSHGFPLAILKPNLGESYGEGSFEQVRAWDLDEKGRPKTMRIVWPLDGETEGTNGHLPGLLNFLRFEPGGTRAFDVRTGMLFDLLTGETFRPLPFIASGNQWLAFLPGAIVENGGSVAMTTFRRHTVRVFDWEGKWLGMRQFDTSSLSQQRTVVANGRLFWIDYPAMGIRVPHQLPAIHEIDPMELDRSLSPLPLRELVNGGNINRFSWGATVEEAANGDLWMADDALIRFDLRTLGVAEAIPIPRFDPGRDSYLGSVVGLVLDEARQRAFLIGASVFVAMVDLRSRETTIVGSFRGRPLSAGLMPDGSIVVCTPSGFWRYSATGDLLQAEELPPPETSSVPFRRLAPDALGHRFRVGTSARFLEWNGAKVRSIASNPQLERIPPSSVRGGTVRGSERVYLSPDRLHLMLDDGEGDERILATLEESLSSFDSLGPAAWNDAYLVLAANHEWFFFDSRTWERLPVDSRMAAETIHALFPTRRGPLFFKRQEIRLGSNHIPSTTHLAPYMIEDFVGGRSSAESAFGARIRNRGTEHSDWLGSWTYWNDPDWRFSARFGFTYFPAESRREHCFLFSLKHEWLWTYPDAYPWSYRFRDSTWLYAGPAGNGFHWNWNHRYGYWEDDLPGPAPLSMERRRLEIGPPDRIEDWTFRRKLVTVSLVDAESGIRFTLSGPYKAERRSNSTVRITFPERLRFQDYPVEIAGWMELHFAPGGYSGEVGGDLEVYVYGALVEQSTQTDIFRVVPF
jgi:hypothetical protein